MSTATTTTLAAFSSAGEIVNSRYTDTKLDAVLDQIQQFMDSTSKRLGALQRKTDSMTVKGMDVTFSDRLSANYLKSNGGTISLGQGRITRPPGKANGIELHPHKEPGKGGFAYVDADGNVGKSIIF